MEVVEGEFCVWEKAVPEIRGEIGVAGREGGNNMVFSGAEVALSHICAVIFGGNKLNREVVGGKKFAEGKESFIVNS